MATNRTIVDVDNIGTMINREHVIGYLHALEELTITIASEINQKDIHLSNEEVYKYHSTLVENLDYMRTKAARDLGRFEITYHSIWMDD